MEPAWRDEMDVSHGDGDGDGDERSDPRSPGAPRDGYSPHETLASLAGADRSHSATAGAVHHSYPVHRVLPAEQRGGALQHGASGVHHHLQYSGGQGVQGGQVVMPPYGYPRREQQPASLESFHRTGPSSSVSHWQPNSGPPPADLSPVRTHSLPTTVGRARPAQAHLRVSAVRSAPDPTVRNVAILPAPVRAYPLMSVHPTDGSRSRSSSEPMVPSLDSEQASGMRRAGAGRSSSLSAPSTAAVAREFSSTSQATTEGGHSIAKLSTTYEPPMRRPLKQFTRKRKSKKGTTVKKAWNLPTAEDDGSGTITAAESRLSSSGSGTDDSGGDGEKCCRVCGIVTTPQWRRGPDGEKSLCNACGLHYFKIVQRERTVQHVPSAVSTEGRLPIEALLNPTTGMDVEAEYRSSDTGS